MTYRSWRLLFRASFLVWLNALPASSERQLTPTNLLFIIFDDLRPELNVYGKSHMITPNFDRLAAKSVVFDHAYAQVAVCNPSRDSLLTGLRPDTLGNYAFQTSFKPHLLFPTQLSRSGYKTSSFGKVLHWDGNDKEVWNTEQYWGEWYDNQNREWDTARSTVWPDKAKNVSSFYDYDFASRAITSLRRHAAAQKDWFMTAIGFKLPHTLLHMPHAYFDMYRSHFQPNSTRDVLAEEEDVSRYTRFPDTCPAISYRCCAGEQFRYMNEEGEKRWKDQLHLRLPDLNLTRAFPGRMHKELLWGYSAAITFVDAQLGRVLDAVDELRLWNNLTIVLTADHGMHNGEKGIWEKWSMFDESTRVPLMIYHPLSPFGGQHYTDPVELIDVFPTVIDLLNPPFNRNKIYNAPRTRHPRRIVPLAGKSLAPMVLGREWIPLLSSVRAHPSLARDYYFPVAEGARIDKGGAGKKRVRRDGRGATQVPAMPLHRHQFALSQIWRCSPKVLTHLDARNESDRKSITAWFVAHRKEDRVIQFLDCDLRNSSQAIQREEDSFMGYSMRTKEFRYTLWIPFDRASMTPQWDDRSTGRNSTIGVFAEELFDHRGETLARELGTKELINLAENPSFALIKHYHRSRLLDFLRSRVLYKAATPSTPPKLWLQASGFNAVHRAVLDH